MHIIYKTSFFGLSVAISPVCLAVHLKVEIKSEAAYVSHQAHSPFLDKEG
jgi:hypothetical protein